MFKGVNKFYVGESILYFIAWAAVLAVPLMHWQFTSQEVQTRELFVAWYKISPYLFLFIINNFLLAPRFLLRKKYGRYVFYTLFTLLATFTVIDLYQLLLDGVWGASLPINRDWYGRVTLTSLSYFWNCFFAMFMMVANSGIKLIYKSMRDDQKLEELKNYNLQVEMDYLKYQVNPHFFMNTLNNIHSLVDFDHEGAKSALVDLSKMMRHVLYESGKAETTLGDEVDFVRHYIELMRLRYDERVTINFSLDKELLLDVSLPPLLLVVLVENAFKHGVVVGEDCFIDIALRREEARLVYRVANSIVSTKHESGGLGLVNLRKRLHLIYGNDFSLEIESDCAEYVIELNIPYV